MFEQIKKRNGKIVPFQIEKIENAVSSAFEASCEGSPAASRLIASMVTTRLSQTHSGILLPDVETIQDLVVQSLEFAGYEKTAKLYSHYRENQSHKRESFQRERLSNLYDRHTIAVETLTDTNQIKLENLFAWLMDLSTDLSRIDLHRVVDTALTSLPLASTIKVEEFRRALIHGSLTLVENHYNYSLLASRILFSDLYESILGQPVFDSQNRDNFIRNYRDSFDDYLNTGITEDLLHSDLATRFDLDRIRESLSPRRDFRFHFRGAKTVADRYLLRTRKEKHIFELPQYFWMRVAMGLAMAEKDHECTDRAIEFYEIISNLIFVPSTPTLFNSGTLHPQLSSCFTTTVDDSLSDIFRTYSDSALLSKYAGGIGADWTNVRAMGSHIRGTNGSSQGVIPFLKIFNDIAVAVNQGGKRKGALAAYLEIWHGDVESFLEAKKNTGDERRRLHDIHTALWIPDLFMKRLRNKENWTLFSPDEVPDLHGLYGKAFEKRYREYESMDLSSARIVSAENLWRKALTMLFETGHPWITFKDPCNIRSPQDHAGVIYGSNLCTEITLNSSKDETAVCNLGSLNLSLLVDEDGIKEKDLRRSVRTAVRMLDNVIDLNLYPTESAKNSNLRHRAVGLGLMGYQEALYAMEVPFDSEANLDFADSSMERISYYAIEASSDLALERGKYTSYEGSKWDRGIFPLDSLDLLEKEREEKIPVTRSFVMDWQSLKEKVKNQGMRNSNLMAIAPTATISNISGTTPSIEPAFRNMYVKENVDGSFIVVNPSLIDALEAEGLWNESIIQKIKFHNGSLQPIQEIPNHIRRLYRTAFDIPSSILIEAAARRGKWIDQSASLNLFISTTSGRALSDLYELAYRLGLKTTYYLRSLSATTVEKSSIEEPMTVSLLSPPEDEKEAYTSAKKKETGFIPVAKFPSGDQEGLCKLEDPDCEACQ